MRLQQRLITCCSRKKNKPPYNDKARLIPGFSVLHNTLKVKRVCVLRQPALVCFLLKLPAAAATGAVPAALEPTFAGWSAASQVAIAINDGYFASPVHRGPPVATQIDDRTVRIDVRHSGPSVVIEVSDEGSGVRPDLAPFVFDRGQSTKSSGLGLGLARDLAEGYGGRLELARLRPVLFALFLSAVDEE